MTVADESLIRRAEGLLAARRSDDAIDLLRSADAPNDAPRCALLARAYHQRGDTRGDVYSSHFFASRAMDLGLASRELYAIRAAAAFRKELFEEAAEYFGRCADEASPPVTQYVYGLALLHGSRAAEAIPWLERAARVRPELAEYADALERARRAAAGGRDAGGRSWSVAAHGLGGPRTRRPVDVASPHVSSALSKLRGDATAARDFDWLNRGIPCQAACPAGTDIPGYLGAIYRGDFERAYRINLHDNVFPGVLGRVCSRPCEAQCRHGREGLGESVAICFSKRSAADFAQQAPVVLAPWFPPTGRTVAVVGAGPAGLAVARNLALMGHGVTVYEKYARPGGMMNQGIPEFRLPRAVVDREVEQVRKLGVRIECGAAVGPDRPLAGLLRDFDAVVMACGTLRPNLLDIPGAELAGIHHGLSFLLGANERRATGVGRNVVVIGGGFTAMDCARTAARIGADSPASSGRSIKVLYRRSRAEMLITPGEVEELNHEGIPMEFMVAPVAYVGEGGHVKAMRFVRTRLGEPDASGRRRPVSIPGSEFEVPADTVLLATGQFPDTAWIDAELRSTLAGSDGWLASGKSPRTAVDRLFVAGDFATGASSLIQAIAHGTDCARRVDSALMGGERLRDVARIEDVEGTGRIREMDAVPRQPMPSLPLASRSPDAEVERGFDQPLAVEEAQRCYLCHAKYEIDPDRCIYCDWCLKAKPRPNCIVRAADLVYDAEGRIASHRPATSTEATKLIWIDSSECIRCNACVDACPVDAISVQRVSRRTVRAADGIATVDLAAGGE